MSSQPTKKNKLYFFCSYNEKKTTIIFHTYGKCVIIQNLIIIHFCSRYWKRGKNCEIIQIKIKHAHFYFLISMHAGQHNIPIGMQNNNTHCVPCICRVNNKFYYITNYYYYHISNIGEQWPIFSRSINLITSTDIVSKRKTKQNCTAESNDNIPYACVSLCVCALLYILIASNK